MSFSASDSRIRLSREQEEHVKTLQPEEIKAYLVSVAEDQKLIFRDPFDRNCIHEIEGATPVQPSQGFLRRVTIDGRETLVEAESELELERRVGDVLRAAVGAREESTTTAATAPTATEETPLEVAQRVELDLRFRRGEISVSQYVEQSGAVKQYLENQGIPLDDLRSAIQEKNNTRFEQSWADATEEFLNGPYGSDWPGGNQNREILGMKLVQLGLEDAPDKVQALAQAYAAMKSENRVAENKELTMHTKISEANSPSELRELLSQGRADYHTIYGK
jgi:hypothetical protein